jgi:hypothetical protein
MGELTSGQFVFAWAIDTAAAVAVFLHATKHGNRHATAWGIGVFLALIVFLPAYLLRSARLRKTPRR